MDGHLLLLPSENSRPDNGPLQGSQGLLQTLLDLGEAFLASEIGEDDLQDLETKLSAARSRDYGTIRDLQKKIEELSGMSAMVNRLKNELREEKEKAKEEAEDFTQEMAELRYQLMERVDEERELRVQTEEASLRRISELEAQLKHAWQETPIVFGRKQLAEAHAQARALEPQHLKSAFEMEKTVEALKQSIIEKDQVLAAQKEDLLVQKEINKSLISHSVLLDSELLAVRKELLLCESQANEMGSMIANLQEALLLERMKTAQAQEDTNLQTRRLSRQDEDYLHLKMRFDGLVSNLETVQMNLTDSREREREASAQVKKLGLELLLAKQELVKSEVRLQRALKQKEEQLDAERGKLENAISAQKQAEWRLQRALKQKEEQLDAERGKLENAIAAQKQAEWHLHKQTEELKSLEGERIELQRLLGQVRGTCDQLERERDDLKVAYAELENQFSRRRTAFAR